MTTEAIVYIHGVMPEREVGRHTEDYDRLHDGIASHFATESAFRTADRIDVEWGWKPEDDPSTEVQARLTEAEGHLFPRVLEDLNMPVDDTINPFRLAVNKLRQLMLFGFGDAFYYVSEDGKYSVRATVARQICDALGSRVSDDGPPLSLTLVGHSLGSVIAFDFAFWLFFEHEHAYLGKEPVDRATLDELKKLREMAKAGRLRIRRLFTFGSPIALVTMRSNAVVEIFARGQKIDPSFHGLTQNPEAFGPALTGPRWVNVFDRDDPISFPVRPLMTAPGDVVEDAYIDVSDNPARAHGEYWRDPVVQRRFADGW